MSTPAPQTPRVSVIIPVYNAVEHLDECVQSLVDQTLGFDRMEVIAIDDGSTDGSAEALDRWADAHRNITVVHQPNSGAPGGPRNRGIDLAAGEFLFFADPDDYLGAEALERLTAAADRDSSDVVLGRTKGVGRTAAVAPFAHNVEAGDIWTTKGVWALTAHKLFRRALVEKHRLRFAEGLRLAEEQVFIVPAYFLAASISVVADYDCYYLVRRDDFPHLTQQTPEPEPFYRNVRDVLDIVVKHTEPGGKRNDLLKRWVTQEILRYFKGGFPAMPAERQQRFVAQAGALLRDFVPDEVTGPLPPLDRLRCQLLRTEQTEELAALAALVPKQQPKPKAKAKQPPPPWLSRAGARRLTRAIQRRIQA
ncbi:glycosyltransferase family 2 protein [Streptomyces sp. IBSBF 2435]|uniref:glycosyltransferase family 2 protein n=1 Tax=Streptomyces sp. IBSBF 2435 TaxID=2903531 RepID=UPI002FDC3A3E